MTSLETFVLNEAKKTVHTYKQGEECMVAVNGQWMKGQYMFFSGNLHNVKVGDNYYGVRTDALKPIEKKKMAHNDEMRLWDLEDEERRLKREIARIESEQENDPEVLKDPSNGSNPAVQKYGDEMEKVYNELEKVYKKMQKIMDRYN